MANGLILAFTIYKNNRHDPNWFPLGVRTKEEVSLESGKSYIINIKKLFDFNNIRTKIETKNKHLITLFISYIEVTFLNLQHKIKLMDTSVISFKTDNLLKTIGKLIF